MTKAKSLLIAAGGVLLGLCSQQAMAQKDFAITGSVRDRLTNSYVLHAKVECLNDADSVVGTAWAINSTYDYRRHSSTTTADFKLEMPRVKGMYTLRITREEFDTVMTPLNLTNIGAREYDRAIGTFYMDRTKTVQLKEIEVTASKVMFYNRGDTLVYNAAAFELADGSMLDALIEQLPGVELREGGQIYVNGKFVQSLLLNGKDFFRGDNQLMLDNLAAYTVKDIEVYNKQTDRGRFLNRDDNANKEYVMDVKLKKEYIGGWIVNAEAAGGTEDRYLARLFAMNFSALSQFTVLGNANNLNDDTRPTAEDKWDPERQSDGVRRHLEFGFDYSTENVEATRKASGNVVYQQDRRDLESTTEQTLYLPGQNTFSRSASNTFMRNFRLSTDHKLYMQTPGVALTFKPRLVWTRDKSNSDDEGVTSLEEQREQLINSTLYRSLNKTTTFFGDFDFDMTIKVPRTSDAIDVWGQLYFNTDNSEQESSNIIRYGDASIPTDARHSRTDNDPSHFINARFGAKYNLVLNSKFNATLSYTGFLYRRKETSAYYLGMLEGSHTGDFTLEQLEQVKMNFDPLNSHKSTENNSCHKAEVTLSYKFSDHWSLSGNLPLNYYSRNLNYRQNGVEYPASYSVLLFEPNVKIEWSDYGSGNGYAQCYASYMRYSNMPSLTSLITIPDTRNPLSQFVGNPDLKHFTTDYFYIYASKGAHNLTLYTMNNLNVHHNYIANGYVYDLNSGKRTYKSYNVNGNWEFQTYNYCSWYWDKINCYLKGSFNFSHDVTHSMLGTSETALTRVRRVTDRYTPSVSIDKYFGTRYNQRNIISLSVEPVFTHTSSTDVNDSKLNPVDVNYKLGAKFELPFSWSVSSSINLRTRRGYNTPMMNREEWIWNARVSKSFLKGQLLASVVAYDLLHQHQAVNYYVTSQMRTETFTNTIPRYILLDLQYKINIMPKKKIEQNVHYY